jgi:tRNA modification GTPase
LGAGYLREDTVAAVATALGGPIAIVRISGPEALHALRSLAGNPGLEPKPRELARARLRTQSGKELDDAMVVFFPNPDSFTGEDVCELHQNGGSFGVSQVLEELCRLGVRQALRGEFSFRAVRNGKLSLAQALAVPDLIGAKNPEAVALALSKLSGLQSRLATELGESLRRLAALGEAGIDFSDQDLDEVGLPRLKATLEPLRETLKKLCESHARGLRIQDGLGVAFVGCPNAGKSSFFNALLGEDRSIVSELPGTTRDVIREKLTLRSGERSVTLRLEDTAGLRDSTDTVEKIGIARSLESARAADLVLFVVDATAPAELAHREWLELSEAVPTLPEKTLGILAKSDLLLAGTRTVPPFPLAKWVLTSSVTGSGISEAVQSIIEVSGRWTRREPGEVLLTSVHELEAAQAGLSHLERAALATELDLFAADLRQALSALGPLIGDTPPDDLLGRIFSDFCIGK